MDLVSDAQLSALQKYVKYVLVLACDKAKDKNDNGKVGEEDCEEALVNMEDIGDALRERGVSLVVVKGSFLVCTGKYEYSAIFVSLLYVLYNTIYCLAVISTIISR